MNGDPSDREIQLVLQQIDLLNGKAFELFAKDLFNATSDTHGITVRAAQHRSDGGVDLIGAWSKDEGSSRPAYGQAKRHNKNPGYEEVGALDRAVRVKDAKLVYFVCNRAKLAPLGQARWEIFERENPGLVFKKFLRADIAGLIRRWWVQSGPVDVCSYETLTTDEPREVTEHSAGGYDPNRWVSRRRFLTRLGIDRSAKNVDQVIADFSQKFGDELRYDILQLQRALTRIHPKGLSAPTVSDLVRRLTTEFPTASIYPRWLCQLADVWKIKLHRGPIGRKLLVDPDDVEFLLDKAREELKEPLVAISDLALEHDVSASTWVAACDKKHVERPRRGMMRASEVATILRYFEATGGYLTQEERADRTSSREILERLPSELRKLWPTVKGKLAASGLARPHVGILWVNEQKVIAALKLASEQHLASKRPRVEPSSAIDVSALAVRWDFPELIVRDVLDAVRRRLHNAADEEVLRALEDGLREAFGWRPVPARDMQRTLHKHLHGQGPSVDYLLDHGSETSDEPYRKQLVHNTWFVGRRAEQWVAEHYRNVADTDCSQAQLLKELGIASPTLKGLLLELGVESHTGNAGYQYLTAEDAARVRLHVDNLERELKQTWMRVDQVHARYRVARRIVDLKIKLLEIEKKDWKRVRYVRAKDVERLVKPTSSA